MKNLEPAKWDLEKRIVALVAYFDKFDLSLNKDFIQKYVFGNATGVDVTLEKLAVEKQFLDSKDNLFFLKGREEILRNHSSKQKLSEKYINKFSQLGWIFRSIPFIEYVAICNYLPFQVVEEDSDVDLLVVTKSGRIFLSRLLLTMIVHLMGLRRHKNKIKGRLCLSFYVTDQCLDFRPVLLDENDIYMAFWVLGLLPIYDRDNYHYKVISENEIWLNRYFEKAKEKTMKGENVFSGKNFLGKLGQKIFTGWFGDKIESLLENYFMKRHQKKLPYLPREASIEVSRNRLKFHNQDRRDYFRKRWLESLESLQIL